VTIPADVIERLPDQARVKLLLLAGLRDDALDMAHGAQGRLNEIGRRRGGPSADDPNVARLSALIATQNDRHETLAGLVAGCVRWLRALPAGAMLEPVSSKPPDLEAGQSPEAAVMRLRARIAELSVERLKVSRATEPKAEVKRQLRLSLDAIAKRAKPSLKLERGRCEPVFSDPRRDFGLTEDYAAGLLGWLFPKQLAEAVDAMVDQLPDHAAVSSADQAKKLAVLSTEIEALERAEEAMIELALAQNVDILRRRNADPAAVLGVAAASQAAAAAGAAQGAAPARAAAE
jgi:hypothetical protein